jgi:hypothetical protein
MFLLLVFFMFLFILFDKMAVPFYGDNSITIKKLYILKQKESKQCKRETTSWLIDHAIDNYFTCLKQLCLLFNLIMGEGRYSFSKVDGNPFPPCKCF